LNNLDNHVRLRLGSGEETFDLILLAWKMAFPALVFKECLGGMKSYTPGMVLRMLRRDLSSSLNSATFLHFDWPCESS
jgi:hypothetical protein